MSAHKPHAYTALTTSRMNRRGFLRAAAIAMTASTAGVATLARAPRAAAAPASLGTIVDFSAGVPSAQSIKNAGHIGSIRYISEPRSSWMRGKPLRLAETQAMADAGLSVASVYQSGGGSNPDWAKGAASASEHAPQAMAIHINAGGPTGRPIYIAVDANPDRTEYVNLIRPYLQGFEAALNLAGFQAGVYGNYSTIDWCIEDGIGEFYWMHHWGSNGQIHPKANLRQRPNNPADKIDGIGIDINDVYTTDWGQWTPTGEKATLPTVGDGSVPAAPDAPAGTPGGATGTPTTNGDGAPTAAGNATSDAAGSSLPKVPDGTYRLPNGSSVDADQINEFTEIINESGILDQF